MNWQSKLQSIVRKWFKTAYASGLRCQAPGRHRSSRPPNLSRLEVLEDRIVPANFTPGDLAVLQAAASASNTTGSILELSPTTANQASPVLNIGISGTGTNAIRISGSAGTTGYLADSNDGTYVEFTGANSQNTSSNANTLNPRAVVALTNSTTVTLPATYTGISGNQTRGATTLDDSDWVIGDQGGVYTNGATAPSPSGNILSVKSFGGTVYAFRSSGSNPAVGTLSSPSGSAITALPGIPAASSGVDFYMIQSGSNGSTFDVLYILSETSATVGTIAKYSLVDGSWTANGSYTTNFGGFGLAAANNGSGGAYLYATTGSGATTANKVIELTDTAGYNTAINITTANNVTLYTAAAGTILKGIAFAPVANTSTDTTVADITPLTASTAQSITLTATVTNSGSSAAGSGAVEFINGGASGTVLGVATAPSISGSTSTWSVSTLEPLGTFSDIQAYYIANVGSGFSSSVSTAYGSTLSIGTPTTTALTSITATSPFSGQPVSFTATVSATTGSTAPTAGSVEFFNGGTSGTLLATATSEMVNGTTATFTVTTSSIAPGTYNDIQAFYTSGPGFVASNSTVYGSALALQPPGVISQWTFPVLASSPDNSPAPTYGSGTVTSLGMTNDYNSGNATSDDVLVTSGTANPNLSEDTWRIRGVINDGWASAAAGAAEYSQGIEVDSSTVGYSNIVFSFDWYATGDSIRDLQVQYNTDTANPDGWTNYQGPSPTGTFVATPGDFYNADLSPGDPTITINLSNIAAANNDPNLGIRLVSAFDSTGNVPHDYASATLGSNGLTVPYDNNSGNWRFGNLTFSYGTTTSTAVTASPTGTDAYGSAVTFTATVTPASGSTNPTGTVAFYDGATQIGTTQTLTNGTGNTATASININTLAVGIHDITAVYVAASGNGFLSSGSSMNLTTGINPIAYDITGIDTTSVVTSSLPSPQQLGTTITFTDTITPVSGDAFPSGTVKFYDNGTKIGSTQTVVAGAGNTGTASVTISTLTLGDQDITAEYFPTANYGASTSPILDESIIPNLLGPIITEFVASNGGDLTDAAGDTPDWLEIYNPTSSAINLAGYALTNDSSNLNEWIFPDETLAAGGYLVVFCDSLNFYTPTEIHTNFNIGSDGGYLALVNPSGEVITQYQYPTQYADISYGMAFDGTTPLTGQIGYFATPTPSAPNGTQYAGYAGTVAASVPAGFYTGAISVTLTTPTPGASIYYTLDGSVPTTGNGILYTGALSISSETDLRAEAYAPGYFSAPSVTWSYIYTADVVYQSPHDAPGYPTLGAPPAGWPSSWGPNYVDYGMDQTIVNDVGAAQIEEALTSLPVISISTDLNGLFNPTTGIYSNADDRGDKVDASIELINPDGVPGFQINAGLSIRGGFSRESGNPKHSFHISFGTQFGGASSLNYPLFGDQPGVATSFDGIDLRTEQNNSWNTGGDPNMTMMEDPFERGSMGAMGQPTTHSIWINVFIDGQYWGIYEIEERIDPLFAATYLNEPTTDNYDILRAENGSYTVGVEYGNLNAYDQLWSYVTTHNMANNANYYFIQGMNANGVEDPSIPNSDVLLDVPDLIDYMIDIYQGGDEDAPISAFLGDAAVNNFFAMRDEDGRQGFVFLQHDAEWSLQSTTINRLGPYDVGGPGDEDHFNPQYLFQVLTANAEFRQEFADQVQAQFYGDGAYTNANMLARYEANANAISVAIYAESARWGDSQTPTAPLTEADWQNAINNQEGVLLNRNAVVLQQFVTAGWISTVEAPEFEVNGSSDIPDDITSGSLLTFANTGGLVYFTTDGSDPRLVGGGINPLAQVYNPSQSGSALVINSSTQVNARALVGTTWSALSTQVLSTAVPATAGNLAITELQYDPLADAGAIAAPDDDAQNFEYIELRNIGSQAIDLAGVQFTQGVTFNFSSGNVLFLNPGQSVVVVSNLQAFEDRYGTAPLVAGVYDGNLSNSGETVTLVDATGAVIQSFAYSNSSSWPQSPHGTGPSLTVINVDGDYNLATNWRASYAALGTPGYNEGVDTVPQYAPTNVQAALSGYTATSTGSVSITNLLTWTALSDVTEYSVERATSPDGPFVQIGTSTEANYADSGLTPGTTYYYQICGVNAVGNGPFSNVLSVAVPAVPADPTAAMVTSVTSTSIGLSWTDNADNEDGYQIYRSDNGGAYALVGNVAADTATAPSSVSYTDTGLTPGVIYAYEIVAYNLAGASDPTDVTTTTLLAAPDLVFSQRNGNSATLFFSDPTGTTSFNVYRGTASGQETLLASGVTSSPYTDSTLETGVTYYYQVTAVNANAAPAPNESAPSNETSPSTGGGAFQWTGDGGDNNWSTAANWLGGVAPTGNANETLIFPSGANQLANVDDFPEGSNFFNDIIVTGAGYSFTVNNNLVLGASGLLVSGSGTDTISGATNSIEIFLASDSTFNVAAGSALVVNTPIEEMAFTLTLVGAGSDTLNGTLDGSGGLVITSQGSVTINGSNTYTGSTQVNSGNVNLGSDTAFGVNNDVTIALSATVVLQGVVTPGVGLQGEYYNATPNSSDFVSLPTLSTYISGLSPSLTELSSATSLDGNFDFADDGSSFPSPYNANATNFIAVYSGLFDAPTTGSYTFDTGSDDGSMIFIDGNVVVNNNGSHGLTVTSGTVNLTAGEHDIVIAYFQGTGGYALYADVQIPGGSLERLPDSLLSAVTPSDVQFGSLSGAGTLELGSNQLTIGGDGNSSTFSGVISGTGSLIKTGAGTLILGQPQYTGTTTISAGTLQIDDGVDPLTVLPTSSIVDNSELVFDSPAGNQLTYSQMISGSGGMSVIGSGTLYLDGTNSYQGPTLIAAGIVDALNNSALGYNSAVTVDTGATVDFSGLLLPGLSGTYYSSAPNEPNSASFDSLGALNAYVATLPVLTTDSSFTDNGQNNLGNNFDYGTGGAGFPAVIQSNPNNFIAVWTGEFQAQVTGTYTFDTGSDDGSMIYIDGNVVVNNNAFQGVTVRSGSVTLTAGFHNIVIAYYQGGGGYGMYADLQAPGGTLERLPNDLLVDNQSQINFGSLAGGGNIIVDSSNVIAFNVGANNSNTVYSGDLSGFAELTKIGTGTLTLASTNTYYGSTAINSGVVIATANGALGGVNSPGVVVNAGGALDFTGGLDYTIPTPITISGSGPAGNGAIENISGNNTFTGNITLSALATIGSDAGLLTLSGNIAVGSSTLTVVGAGNTLISANVTTEAGIANSGLIDGDFTKPSQGTGFTYDPTGSAWTFTGGAVLQGNGSAWGYPNTPSGSQSASLQDNTANALDYSTISQTFDWLAGTDTISFYLCQRPGEGILPVNVQVDGVTIYTVSDPGTTWTLYTTTFTTDGGSHTLTFSTSPLGTGDFDTGLWGVSVTGIGVGNVVKSGTGTLTLSNDNTAFLGSTTITAGSLIATVNGAMGPGSAAGIVVNGGTLGLAGGVDYTTDEPVTISGSGANGTGAIANISGTNTFTSNINLSGSATIGSDAGLLTLSGNIAVGPNTLTVVGAGSTLMSGNVAVQGSSTGSGLMDGDFTTPAQTTSPHYTYDPTGSAWTFTGGAVLQENGSAWGYPNTPGGSQSASLQDNATISQTFDWPAGTDTINFYLCQRPGESILPVNVQVDGVTIYTVTDPGTTWTLYTTTFTTDGGSHTLTFSTSPLGTGDFDTGLWGVSVDIAEGSLIQSGTGTLTLSNDNTTFLGTTTIDAGTLIATVNGAMGPAGAAGITVNGGTLAFSGGVDYSNAEPVTISGSGANGAGAIANISGTNTFTGNITLSSSATIGTTAGQLNLSGNIINQVGSVASGLIDGDFTTPAQGSGYQYDPTGSAWTFSGGAVLQGNGSAWGYPVTPGGSQSAGLQGSSTHTTGSISQTFNWPTGTDTISFYLCKRPGYGNLPVQVQVNGTTIYTVSTIPSTWTLFTTTFTSAGGSNTLTFSVTGGSGDNDTGLWGVSVTGETGPALTTTGAGTLILSSDNSGFYGTVTVDAGTLVVNGQFPNTSGVTVNSGATLAGTGSISAPVVVSGGVVNPSSPLNTPGTLTVGSMNFSNLGNLTADITNGSTSLLSVTNSLTLGGTSTLSLDLAGLTSVPSGPITIVTDDSQTGQFGGLYVFNNPNDYQVSLGYLGTSITVTISSTPNPTATIEADAGSNPSPDGANATFTVSVTSASPISGETVQIEDASNGDAVVATPTLTNGTATFSISSLSVGSHNLYAVYTTDGTNGSSYSNIVTQVVLPPLVVNSATAIPDGFVLTFNEPINESSLVLYSGPGDTTLGAADFTVTGTSTGAVRGSLLVDPTNPDMMTFVATKGLLPADTYTVVVTSSVTGVGGYQLAGNYSTAVTVATTTTPVMSVPSFARGPGQTVALTDTTGNTTGIPVDISGASSVTAVSFTLTYDPTLLTIANSGAVTLSTAATAAGLTGLSYSITSTDSHHSVLVVTITGSGTGLTTSSVETLVTIAASVPTTAPYVDKSVLNLGSVMVNSVPGAGLSGVDVVAYVGDVLGTGLANATDASLVDQVGSGAGTGFSTFKDLDPSIIAGVDGGLFVNADDASLINEAASGAVVSQIPTVPGGISLVTGGPDPYLYLSAVHGAPGQTVTETLYLDVTDPNGIQLTALDEAIGFDAGVLQVSDVRGAASLLGLGSYATDSTVDDTSGVFLVGQAFMGTGLPPVVPYGTDIPVLQFNVTLSADMGVGSQSDITLLQYGTVNGMKQYTAVSDNEGALSFTPGKVPSNSGNAAVDGSVTVLAVTSPVVGASETSTVQRSRVAVEPVRKVTPVSHGASTVVISGTVGNLAVTVASVEVAVPGEETVFANDSSLAAPSVESSAVSSPVVISGGEATTFLQAGLVPAVSARFVDAGASLSLVVAGTNKGVPGTSTGNVKTSMSVLDEIYRQFGMDPIRPAANNGLLGATGLDFMDEVLDIWDLEYMLQEEDSMD